MALRTRQSAANARVTLFSLVAEPSAATANDIDSSEPIVGLTSSTIISPATRRSRSVRTAVKTGEGEDSSPAPSTPRLKRARARKAKDESDLDSEGDVGKKEPKRPSMSPRKPTPTKIRAKLEVAHPEPPRWRETYEIVSVDCFKL